MSTQRIAIVHDWLVGMRGGERVLAALLDIYPGARVHALFHVPGTIPRSIEDRVAGTSPLQHLARGLGSRYRYLLPLFPWAVARMDLAGADLVISVSHCVAHAASVPAGVPHLAYVLSPMRYIWDRAGAYREQTGRLARLGLRLAAPWLRRWDRESAGGLEAPGRAAVACSGFVQGRILAAWGMPSEILYPPVEWQRFRAGGGGGGYDLVVSALVPGKGIDLAVRAYRTLGRRLVVAGEGPERGRLARLAGPRTEFLGHVPEADLPGLYARAEVVVVPGVEDFGLVPVEAQAAGRPVLACGRGGAAETVRASGESPTGAFFGEETPEALAEARERMDEPLRRGAFRPDALREHARRFEPARFRAGIEEIVRRLGSPGEAVAAPLFSARGTP